LSFVMTALRKRCHRYQLSDHSCAQQSPFEAKNGSEQLWDEHAVSLRPTPILKLSNTNSAAIILTVCRALSRSLMILRTSLRRRERRERDGRASRSQALTIGGLSANTGRRARRNTISPTCRRRPTCAPWRPPSRRDGFASRLFLSTTFEGRSWQGDALVSM
jgi:hypothetical protein